MGYIKPRDYALDYGKIQQHVTQITRLQRQAEDERLKLVSYIRTLGGSWQDVGDALGVSRQAAFKAWSEQID